VLELDEYVGKARLRDFWKRARALSSGVLTLSLPPPDQGFRELVALCSVCEAHRRISATISRKDEDKVGAEEKEQQTKKVDFIGKEFFAPLISLLTGGAVASTLATIKPEAGASAALAGVLTALVSTVAFHSSSSRSRRRSASKEDLFIPDLSVDTLDRVLPLLLKRVQRAGLAPIFVIDELDKVKNLSQRLPNMVRRLKKLVAESAFFCFLTDRAYFEEVRNRTTHTPYSIEYTYFSHQLFVAFTEKDLHWYLKEIVIPPKMIGEEKRSLTFEEYCEQQLGKQGAEPIEPMQREKLLKNWQAEQDELVELEEAANDRTVLPYVLLHTSRMHVLDLNRELMRISGGGMKSIWISG
jgi:hypothetical protein